MLGELPNKALHLTAAREAAAAYCALLDNQQLWLTFETFQ